ncbi:MAG: hypothetical protein E2O78_06865 [Caldithrix sp.]|nr:MAG: hypothetical protein E2O78_06865 [Caldithrix sp.]
MFAEGQTIRLNPDDHEDSVDAFFDFNRLSRSRATLNFLSELLQHFARIPYENISKIINLHESPDWDLPKLRLPETVISQHIDFRLGGTCFSLTFYLQTILAHSGFTCYPVMADMRAGKNIHCCLIVILDSVKYLVDPGYLLTRPMALNPHQPKLFHTEFAGVELRYDTTRNVYDLFTFNKNETKWRHCFRERPVPPGEFLQHWLASFRRNSMHGICLTKVLGNGVLFVNRNFMRETTFTSKRNFNIKRSYHRTIHERFGIDKQIVEQAQVALAENLERERALGLWISRNQPRISAG